MKYYKYADFYRLLQKIIADTTGTYHCAPLTLRFLKLILITEYPYKEEDIEYIMDMINFYMRKKNYTGPKKMFPISKYLDKICRQDFYIDQYVNKLTSVPSQEKAL